MCGIIGISNADPNTHVNQTLVDGLTLLQHRGQDAAGIVTLHNGRFHMRKHKGPVSEVFSQQHMLRLRGCAGIGHVRYPTSGGGINSGGEAQPFFTTYPYGIALAHNGNLTNAADLRAAMEASRRHINTDSDSELLMNVIADELQRRQPHQHATLSPEDIFDAIRIVMRKCRGGYTAVVLINHIGMVAFRDPHGIRPLCFGTRPLSNAYSNQTASPYLAAHRSRPSTYYGNVDIGIASESVALEALTPRFTLERDVMPGEAIFIALDHTLYTRQLVIESPEKFAPCLFEYVYFARPDSILDGVKVYDARAAMGLALAKKFIKLNGEDHNVDVVIPIPETSRTAAMECANALKRPYKEAFVKNRYIARTFIMPEQETRRKTVRLKLNTIPSEFKDKNVLLIDDSIVRGTTSLELVQMAREAGARIVYFASAAPPVRFPDVYGIDIPTRQELVAFNRSNAEIEEILRVDQVIYNDLEDVVNAVTSLSNNRFHRLDDSCFSGCYVTDDIDDAYLAKLEEGRGKNRSGAVPRSTVSDEESIAQATNESDTGPVTGSTASDANECRTST